MSTTRPPLNHPSDTTTDQIAILLVEDELAHRTLIERSLQPYRERLRIFSAASLVEARAVLKEHRPDIIVTDLVLPDGRGTELIVKDENGECLLPTVLMTSHGDQNAAVNAIKSGAFDYVVKSDAVFSDMYHIVERSMREWMLLVERKKAEVHLRESEELYRTLFDAATVAIMLLRDSVIVDCNAKTLDLIRCDRETVLNSSISRFAPETQPDGQRSTEKFEQLLQVAGAGLPQSTEWKGLAHSGKVFYADLSMRSIRIRGEKFILAILHDMTSRKEAEDLLQARDAFLQHIISTIPNLVFWKDREFVYQGCNQAFARVMGLNDTEAVVGKTDEQLKGALRDLVVSRECDRKVIETGHPIYNLQESIIDAEGVERIVLTSKIPLRDAAGDVNGLLGIYSDVTELRKTIYELRDSRNLLQSIFDSIPSLLSVHDSDCRIIMSNWKEHDFIPPEQRKEGLHCYEVYMHRTAPCERCFVKEVFKTGQSVASEIVGPVDGKMRAIVAFPIQDDYGNVVMVAEHMSDVTERKRMERHLVQAEKLSSVGQLVAGISHELNNKLTSILGYAQLFALTGLNEKQSKYRSIIEFETMQAKSIIESLLAFSRPSESRTFTYHSIRDVISGVLNISVYKLRTANIQVLNELPDDLPKVKINAIQIEQVFLNIISNAIEVLTQTGGFIRIVGSVVDRTVCVEIIDNGSGIPQKFLTRVFDPFFTTKDVGKGTGLGLSVAYGIVKDHGGTISADNADDGGACITVCLPVDGPQGQASEAVKK